LRLICILLFLLVVNSPIARAAEQVILVGSFSRGSLSDWSSRSFKGETKYQLVEDAGLQTTVLAASTNAAASGRYRKISIDLTKTPFLNWSWKVTDIFPGIDEGRKSGDDFPARIYVVVECGLLGARSLALNYVWASQHGTGSEWPSPYTAQVHLIAVDSGQKGLGSWIQYKRNVRDDLRRTFGEEISEIDAVAIMTDADDHKGRTQTFYGDIWFSPE
jgi:hypothetical protein